MKVVFCWLLDKVRVPIIEVPFDDRLLFRNEVTAPLPTPFLVMWAALPFNTMVMDIGEVAS